MSYTSLSNGQTETLHRGIERLVLSPTDRWIAQHPVLSILNPDDRALCLQTGTIARLAKWEVLDHSGRVLFVLDGILGTKAPGSRVGLAISGAGSVVWPSKAFDRNLATQQYALTESVVLSIAREDLSEAFGRSRFADLELRQSQAMYEALVAEAICNAEHSVVKRLAKWLLRFHFAAGRDSFEFTQAEFADWIGVQRTSVNNGAGQISEVGGIRVLRGKISVRDASAIQAMSCGCKV